jgi:hypothetical protein
LPDLIAAPTPHGPLVSGWAEANKRLIGWQTQRLERNIGFLEKEAVANNLVLDPKLQLGFPRCWLYRDGARDRDLVLVVDHPFDVTNEKLPLRVEGRARLQARVRARAELPNARVHKSSCCGDRNAATSSAFARVSRSRQGP